MSSAQFAFLAQPPPPRRAIPAALPAPPCPPPPIPVAQAPRRKNSNIATWAALVQPGSPAPRSPHRRPSLTGSVSSRRPSLTRMTRRPSITHGRAPSGSFIHLVHTPTRTHTTPSVAEFDLTALGYTSVFVHLDKTPTTPSPLLRQLNAPAKPPTPLTADMFAHIPIPPIPAKRVGMKRFRSFGLLRHAKQPASPTKSTGTPSKTKSSSSIQTRARSQSTSTPEICAATIAKRKQAKYAYVRPPPTLANELALMQFADGGSMEANAKRVMQAQAKAAGAGVGVGDVYRDGKGGMWWDADEEVEYAHLLGGMDVAQAQADADEMDWEEFDSAPLSTTNKENAPIVAADLVRRTSAVSAASTTDSLDPKYLLPLPETDAQPTFTSGTLNDRVLASTHIGGPGMSVLSLPSRPRRKAAHLCKAPGFLVDVGAFAPRSPGFSSSMPKSPRSPTAFSVGMMPKGKARRRPAPLKLASSAHARANAKVALVGLKRHGGHSPTKAQPQTPHQARKEFLEESFAPVPVSVPPTTTTAMTRGPIPTFVAVESLPPPTKPLRLGGMRGLFARKGN